MDDDAYIRLDAAAALLGLSPRQTRRYAEGNAPRLRLRTVKHRTLVHQGDVEALARDFATAQASPAARPQVPQAADLPSVEQEEQPDPLTIGEIRPLQELADEFPLTYHSLRTYAKTGRLKAVKFGKQWATTRQAIEEYLASRDVKRIPQKRRNRS